MHKFKNLIHVRARLFLYVVEFWSVVAITDHVTSIGYESKRKYLIDVLHIQISREKYRVPLSANTLVQSIKIRKFQNLVHVIGRLVSYVV